MASNRSTNFPNGISTPGTERISGYLNTVISGFGDLRSVERTQVIELKSNYGLSALRDDQTVTESGAISNNNIEYLLSTGTTTNSTANLASAERGRYMPGSEAQAGIGVRLDHTFTGTQDAQWGYFDAQNGFGFGSDATGVYVFIRRAGTTTKTYQTSWSADKLDGLGESKATLDLSRGNIFNIDFSWYGYGVIEYCLFLPNPDGKQIRIVVHRISPNGATSVADPNLPITAYVTNGDTTEDIDLYVGGRQFSVFSKFNVNRRVNGEDRLSKGSIGETFLPIISFRKKEAFKTVAVKIEGFDSLVDASMVYQIRLAPTLTDASFATPSNTTAAETACEADTSATAVTGGQILYRGLINSSGSGANASGGTTREFEFQIPGQQIVTLCARKVSGTGGTISASLRWAEEW